MRGKFVFVGNRLGRGTDTSADIAAIEPVFDALEAIYGEGIFTKRNNNSIDFAMQNEVENKYILTISTDIPEEKFAEFNEAVIRELNRAGLKASDDTKPSSTLVITSGNPQSAPQAKPGGDVPKPAKPLTEAEIEEVLRKGNLKQLQSLLEANPNFVKRTDKHRVTPLHVATRAGNEVAVKLLLTNGAAVNARDNYGLTPLHYAVLERPEKTGEVATVLIANGADVKARTDEGLTPLSVIERQKAYLQAAGVSSGLRKVFDDHELAEWRRLLGSR